MKSKLETGNTEPTSREEAGRREQPAGATGTCSCGTGTTESGRHPGEHEDEFRQRQRLADRLGRIGRKIVVLSGKGGVGKSTVAVNLAVTLAAAGRRVGLLDVDIHGPSVPTMLGLEDLRVEGTEDGLQPVPAGGVKVMSLGFFLNHPDDAVIWRGPMKMGAIRQFLADVAWGELDDLVIDSPPGTGDEPLSVCQLIGNLDGAVVVTTPQKVAAVDVRKSISFCRKLNVPVLGVVENMSGFVCPQCGTVTSILRSGGGRQIAADMEVPFLGSIPLDPRIAESGDEGRALVSDEETSSPAKIMREVLAALVPATVARTVVPDAPPAGVMQRIAIPLADGRLAQHFGHCECFALVDVSPATGTIVDRQDVAAPPHQPGLLPPWLAERGAAIILAGGMGQRAQELFTGQGIRVIVGAPSACPEDLVRAYLAGTLEVGVNTCDH